MNLNYPKRIATNVLRRLPFRTNDPLRCFHWYDYLRHNARRLEHLASLRIPVRGMTVLDVSAGIGDHSHYYIDRHCAVTLTDVRPENLRCLRTRYPRHEIQFLDMERPGPIKGSPFEIVHCYGLLYHLAHPEQALEFLNAQCTRMMFLETCVSFGDDKEVNPVTEDGADPSQAFSGTGCRPTRRWVFEKLQGLFDHVYLPTTQPNHEEFPLEWSAPEKHLAPLKRAVFICSRSAMDNPRLTRSLISLQTRHE